MSGSKALQKSFPRCCLPEVQASLNNERRWRRKDPPLSSVSVGDDDDVDDHKHGDDGHDHDDDDHEHDDDNDENDYEHDGDGSRRW